MKNFNNFFKSLESREEAKKTEKETLNQPGNYLETIDTIERLNQKIELKEKEIEKKEDEIKNTTELIIENDIDSHRDIFNNIKRVRSFFIIERHLYMRRSRLEEELLKLKKEKEKLKDERLLLKKNN